MFFLLFFVFSNFAQAESFSCIAQGTVKKCGDCTLPVEFGQQDPLQMGVNCCELHLIQSYGEATSKSQAEQKVLTNCLQNQNALQGTKETKCQIKKCVQRPKLLPMSTGSRYSCVAEGSVRVEFRAGNNMAVDMKLAKGIGIAYQQPEACKMAKQLCQDDIKAIISHEKDLGEASSLSVAEACVVKQQGVIKRQENYADKMKLEIKVTNSQYKNHLIKLEQNPIFRQCIYNKMLTLNRNNLALSFVIQPGPVATVWENSNEEKIATKRLLPCLRKAIRGKLKTEGSNTEKCKLKLIITI